MSLEDIDNTFFICPGNIPRIVVEKLPHYHYNDSDVDKIDNNWKEVLKYRLYKLSKWHFIKRGTIYAEDHQIYISQLLGHQKYTLIEDGPRIYSIIEKTSGLWPYKYKERMQYSWKGSLKYYILNRPTSGKSFGTNSQCIDRWITNPQDLDSPYIKGKNYTLLNYRELWNNANEEKKEFIQTVFGISKALIHSLNNAKVMLFTQPFMVLCSFSEQEMYDLYADALKKYEQKDIVIKPHPRDKFPYEKYFADAYILRTYAPMQILTLMGVCPKLAITVTSTALSELPDTTQKIYLGSKIHPAIFNAIGDQCNS